VGEYGILDHTADMGLRLRATSLEDLFATAARGLMAVMWESPLRPPAPVAGTRRVRLEGSETDLLLVDWLNELLYCLEADGLAFCALTDFVRRENELELEFQTADASALGPRTREVKAATLHGLSLRRTAAGWEAQVIFDI